MDRFLWCGIILIGLTMMLIGARGMKSPFQVRDLPTDVSSFVGICQLTSISLAVWGLSTTFLFVQGVGFADQVLRLGACQP